MTITPEGWYPDGQGGQRWWDGLTWTEYTRPLPVGDAAPAAPATGSVDAISGTDGSTTAPGANPAFGSANVLDPLARARVAAVAAPARPSQLPVPAIVVGIGALLLAVGSFMPWVSIFFLSISGIDTRYGLVTLAVGVAAALLAYQLATGRLASGSDSSALAIAGVVLGVVGLSVALYVGFAIRTSIAESKTGSTSTAQFGTSDSGNADIDAAFDDFAASVEEALNPSTGTGVYVTGLGGLLVAAGSGFALIGDRRRVTPPRR